jgi:polysaccharide deacetylase 2 family uncharacterized protein YibQ
MTADDLSAPLGQRKPKARPRLAIPVPQLIAAALAFFLGVFAVWAVVIDNPYGGEPMVAVPIDLHVAVTKKPDAPAPPGPAGAAQPAGGGDGKSAAAMAPAPPAAPAQAQAANTTTVTIIDGKTGARQDVVIPGGPSAPNTPSPPEHGAVDQRFVEMTTHGPIPKIASDGVRPAEAFARPVKPLPGKPDAPRIALIVGGLGVSAGATSEAIAKLPGAVTLAFMPYSADVERVVARARDAGHEVLLQLPMEPFNYPDNDPGPQTLLTTVTPEQNLDRLSWLMSRFQGYVGVTIAMGARFTASEQSFAPILRETAKRGLIFLDDGTNPRSVAARIAGGDNLPFAKAEIVVDAVPTPVEVEHALGRLELAARERGIAIGTSSALPVSIEHIAKWAKALESRGILLVPVTAAVAKTKQAKRANGELANGE